MLQNFKFLRKICTNIVRYFNVNIFMCIIYYLDINVINIKINICTNLLYYFPRLFLMALKRLNFPRNLEIALILTHPNVNQISHRIKIFLHSTTSRSRPCKCNIEFAALNLTLAFSRKPSEPFQCFRFRTISAVLISFKWNY